MIEFTVPDWWWITREPATIALVLLDIFLVWGFIQRRRQHIRPTHWDSWVLALQFLTLWSVAGMVAYYWAK